MLTITYDPGEIVPLLNWAAVEDSLTIIASSIPTLRPLLTKIFPTTTSQESYNMLSPPPPSYEKKRNIRFDTSLYATQVDRDRDVTDARDNSSQTMILPVTRPKPSAVDKNQINLTTEVSVLYKSNDMV
jgi:hypothetical protein